VNLGVRYDYFMPDVEIRNRLVNFDLTNLKLVYAGEDGLSNTAGKMTPGKNLAPRIGLAWDVQGNGKTVIRSGFAESFFPMQQSASSLLGEQVPYVVSQNPYGNIPVNPTDWSNIPQIQNPLPAIVPLKPKTTAELNAVSINVLGHGFQNETPSMITWGFGVEHQLAKDQMVEVAYAGSHGSHLMFNYNPNEVQPGIGTQAARRLLQPLANLASISQFDPRNSSMYHGLQTRWQKRFSGGLQFQLAYTFSKNIDYGGSAASGGGAVGGPQTVTCLACGRGLSGFDVRNRFIGNYLYEFPFGKGKKWLTSGFLSQVAGGWAMTGIVTLQSGRPFTVYLNTGVNNGAPSWPNRIGSGKLENPDRAYWFNAADFAAPASNNYGNTGRGILYAPGQANWDTSFMKTFPVRERLKLKFQLDVFNITNTPYFGFPNANIGSPTVGVITSTNNDNRDLQFALKLDW
jgi:hypothetical protein